MTAQTLIRFSCIFAKATLGNLIHQSTASLVTGVQSPGMVLIFGGFVAAYLK